MHVRFDYISMSGNLKNLHRLNFVILNFLNIPQVDFYNNIISLENIFLSVTNETLVHGAGANEFARPAALLRSDR